MRLIITAAALAALLALPAQAQDSSWAYFGGDGAPLQAGVQGPEGGQLILKCDEPGANEVFAVIFSPTRLRPSTTRPQVRSLFLRFDEGNRIEVRWRYYEQTVLALNTRRDRNLEPFLRDLVDAENLEVRLDPADGTPFELNFHVAGAREAIDRVFSSCEDDNVLD